MIPDAASAAIVDNGLVTLMAGKQLTNERLTPAKN
jgi:hypothetical protein